MTQFTDEELKRYRRHMVLADFGGEGQKRLKESSVLVVGAGGLGAPLLMYLAAAGVGRIGIVDSDTVSLSNLQRQIVHATPDIGRKKTASAKDTLAALNPHVEIVTHDTWLTADNALDLIGQYDLVADGTDTFATRYLVSDACYFAKKPLVWAAIGEFSGQLSVFKPHEKDENGTPLPGYRDLLPEPPPEGTVPTCREAGVIGALPGILGSMQAMEVIKELTGIGESLAGWLLLYDALSAECMKVRLKARPDNPLTGENPTITALSVHA